MIPDRQDMRLDLEKNLIDWRYRLYEFTNEITARQLFNDKKDSKEMKTYVTERGSFK